MKTASITLINETDNTRDWLELNRTHACRGHICRGVIIYLLTLLDIGNLEFGKKISFTAI